MTALPSYSTGTVSVSAGGTIVTGTGTIWSGVNVKPGDILQIGNFQTIITDVTDVTNLIIPPWGGGAQSGAAYTIFQWYPSRVVGVEAAEDLKKLLAVLNTSGLFVVVKPSESVPDPSLGEEDQYALQTSTGKMWEKLGGVWSFVGTFRGFGTPAPYDNGRIYSQFEVATSNGSSFVFINSTPSAGNAPPNATYWAVLAAKGDPGDPGDPGDVGPAAWITPPTAWATATVFTATAPASVVTQGGETYVCAIPHTSGTFATDLAAGRWVKIAAKGLDGSGVSSLNGQTGALTLFGPPLGRLTLVPGVAVMTSTVSAATIVRYTPSNGNICPIYDGTNFVPTVFTELSQATTDTTKSPAAVAANSNYDKFVWDDTGTKRCTRGPAWTSNTLRGTGAGTTELELLNGVYVNKFAITNGPAARRGTYVGTIRSNASSTIDMIFGGSGSGGVAASFGVWNVYNRAFSVANVIDTSAQYGYTGGGIPRQANGSAGNQASFVVGLTQDAFNCTYSTRVDTLAVSGAFGWIGIGFDTTAANTSQRVFCRTVASVIMICSPYISYSVHPPIGYHTLAAIEASDGTNSCNFNGDSNGTLTLQVWN